MHRQSDSIVNLETYMPKYIYNITREDETKNPDDYVLVYAKNNTAVDPNEKIFVYNVGKETRYYQLNPKDKQKPKEIITGTTYRKRRATLAHHGVITKDVRRQPWTIYNNRDKAGLNTFVYSSGLEKGKVVLNYQVFETNLNLKGEEVLNRHSNKEYCLIRNDGHIIPVRTLTSYHKTKEWSERKEAGVFYPFARKTNLEIQEKGKGQMGLSYTLDKNKLISHLPVTSALEIAELDKGVVNYDHLEVTAVVKKNIIDSNLYVQASGNQKNCGIESHRKLYRDPDNDGYFVLDFSNNETKKIPLVNRETFKNKANVQLKERLLEQAKKRDASKIENVAVNSETESVSIEDDKISLSANNFFANKKKKFETPSLAKSESVITQIKKM